MVSIDKLSKNSVETQNQSQYVICTFISALVHYGLVHSILPSNPSLSSILGILSVLHGTGACRFCPTDHRGRTARHVTTIKAMDF